MTQDKLALYRQLLARGLVCVVCGAVGPCHPVRFERNTGLLVIRFREVTEGPLCWPCIEKTYKKYQTLNMLLGWWGIISFFATIFYIAENSRQYSRAKRALARVGVVK